MTYPNCASIDESNHLELGFSIKKINKIHFQVIVRVVPSTSTSTILEDFFKRLLELYQFINGVIYTDSKKSYPACLQENEISGEALKQKFPILL